MKSPVRVHRSASAAALPISTKCMSWKDRQRTRVPCVDLDDNPFCVERRVNEEKHIMQLNRNPSLVHLTSADIPRTASFMVDDEKPRIEFARRKRNLLAWSLRAGKATDGGAKTSDLILEETSPLQYRRGRTTTDEVDVDTLPNLEPYRREVAAQQPITFGHRPMSASRMFNPSTMGTSCHRAGPGLDGVERGRGGGSKKRGYSGKGRDAKKRDRKPTVAVLPRKGCASGLSAPMLKELLFRDRRTEDGTSAWGSSAEGGDRSNVFAKTAPPLGGTSTKLDGERSEFAGSAKLAGLADGDDEVTSETSNSTVWRSNDPRGVGHWEYFNASWMSSSLQEESAQGRRRDTRDCSIEELALREIFSADRPPWDGAPAPLPAPRDVRRAVSSLLQPDPDERLREKIDKSRKLAAGVPVTASSIKEEKEREAAKNASPTSMGRWEVSPPTPRTILASEETKRLVEARRERDKEMARRVRQAELSVFYNKIAGAETRYQNVLTRGLKRQGLKMPVVTGISPRGHGQLAQ